MNKRFVAIWFRYLVTDWLSLRQPDLKEVPFATAGKDHGRQIVYACNELAATQGIYPGMLLADARALIPGFQVKDHKPGIENKLLNGIAEWCIRYSPVVSVDLPDGLIVDATGCAHLWGGEAAYLQDIIFKLQYLGYQVRIGMADTIGTAWAVCRYGQDQNIIVAPGVQTAALLPLPAAALRIDATAIERLQKLGLYTINDFIGMPRSTLRRRFGETFLQRMQQALGQQEEFIISVQPDIPYQERLPCLEPIVTATGIGIALKELLNTTRQRLCKEGNGIRKAVLKCFRVDGKIQSIDIGTSRATQDVQHLFKLFELKLPDIEPDLGIELFLLEAIKVDKVTSIQEQLWLQASGLDHPAIAQMIDRIAGRFGADCIRRYLPAEHYLPERAFKAATSLDEPANVSWKLHTPRPLKLLPKPEPIAVTAPIPDYPPMNFRYRGVLHRVVKADGPERIEQEWWVKEGLHRDYYAVEDEQGQRYWLFRSGHYQESKPAVWYLHGFFA